MSARTGAGVARRPSPPLASAPGARRIRGYTLLEVMIAFSLLAIGMGLMLSILAGGVHSIATAADSTRASLYAQGLLDSLGADRRLQPGHAQGSFEGGRYRWTLDVSAFQTPAATPVPGAPPAALNGGNDNQLLAIALVLRWGDGKGGRSLRVDTLRAYTPPPVVGP